MASKKNQANPNISPTGADNYWQTKLALDKKSILLFDQLIFLDWCKACGICIVFCPKNVFTSDPTGKPVVIKADDCIGCRFCELHCPDFAITIRKRFVDRRKSHGK